MAVSLGCSSLEALVQTVAYSHIFVITNFNKDIFTVNIDQMGTFFGHLQYYYIVCDTELNIKSIVNYINLTCGCR